MSAKLITALFGAALLTATGAFAQDAGDDSGASAQSKWPLAAKAGQDTHSDRIAPPGAVNKGAFNLDTWKRGTSYDSPPGAKLWNPVKIKMMQGGMVTGVTVPSGSNANIYCLAANSGVDYIWTELQHNEGTWRDIYDMWSACPHAKAVPGVRIPNANEFDEQHALDEGALVLVVPTVRSTEEAQTAAKWAFFPPLGGRSAGGSRAEFWGNVPGGYRNTINDNLVLILMIETLDGLRDADKIAATKGVTAVFAASGDLGNFGGWRQGDPDYEREINIVHDAALRAHVRLCGPAAWIGRPDFTCFQGPGGSENGALVGPDARLPAGFLATEKKALGKYYMTQPVPEVGPYSPGWKDPAPARAGE